MKKLVMGATAVLVLAVCLYSAKFFAAGSGQGAVGQETEADGEKPLSARNGQESAVPADASETASQETQTYAETETETESLTQTPAASEVDVKENAEKGAQAKTQAGEKAQPQPAQPQPAQPQPAQPQPAQPQQGDTVTEVSRVYIEDCGQDTGYWEITYSDGHVEHVEE